MKKKIAIVLAVVVALVLGGAVAGMAEAAFTVLTATTISSIDAQ